MPVLAENIPADYNFEYFEELSTVNEEKATRFAHRRLNEAFKSAPVFPFDNSSPLVFFSDIHRGICGKTDPFVKNAAMYYHVLKHRPVSLMLNSVTGMRCISII